MILRPNASMGDPNASRRQMMAQLLQGGPMPAPAPNPAAAMTGGLQQAMQAPDFMKWFQTLLPARGAAPQGMPIQPGSMNMPGLY